MAKRIKRKPLKVEQQYGDRGKLMRFPWPWESDSVAEFNCSEVFQYVPGKLRVRFMEELYRVLAPDGKATLLMNYWSSSSAIADCEVEWPPVSEQSFLFFNKPWREANGIAGQIKCNFDFGYGFAWAPEVASRSTEVQQDWIKSRLNVAHKLQVVLTKIKAGK